TKAPLKPADVERARRALDRAGAQADLPVWLSPDEACDIHFEGVPAEALDSVRGELRGKPFDVNVVPRDYRRKRLLLADMDSTLIEQECIDELAAEIGLKPDVAAITERAMRGEISFEPALRERVGLFKGMSADTAAKLLAERITITPGAKVLVATMRAFGAYAALVSGGFTVFAEPLGRQIGFDEHRANTLLAEGGAFTGAVAEPILGEAAKEEALLELTAKLKLDPRETLAIGDGANDLGMIRLAGLGVAYRAKPAVRAEAPAALDHANLTGVLFLQGYRREEFVLNPTAG
ncbi:MAG TPA: phosphoserine phosphatase SerB, partial [Afifellaceae bacterium]|nr:phosphoserine phosphatase SerB [Afifellaceae bacterium]